MTFAQHQLEELHLLECSLVGGESLTFVPPNDPDALQWQTALENYPDGHEHGPNTFPSSQCRFQVRADGCHISFEVILPPEYGSPQTTPDKWKRDLPSMISIRGDNTTRSEQLAWQKVVADATSEIQDDTEYPLYELICTHLLPHLHEHLRYTPNVVPVSNDSPDNALYHALFTSHHLVSPTKRRNLQTWSSQLSISGFAKVGYPGVIYCEGSKEDVEEFVVNIKGMQWLALKVRFTEPVPESTEAPQNDRKSRWVEYEKVGEVVQEMRRLNRENFVVMGVGSIALTPSS